MTSRKFLQKRNKRNETRSKMFHFHDVNPTIQNIIQYFEKLFRNETNPTRQSLIFMALSMLYKDACASVRGMFKSYVKQFSSNQLTSLYYTLNKSKVFTQEWRLFLLEIILSSVEVIKYLPILFIFDDSLVEKKGEHFELREKLYDHTAKNGSNYLYGHCFVSIVIGIPIMFQGKPVYLRVPLLHKMWDKDSGVSKLQMAKEMTLELDNFLGFSFETAVLCDSWYPRGEVLELHTVHGIPFICAARGDTALYEIPDAPNTGQRGRPRIRGEKLERNREEAFEFVEIEGYTFLIGHKKVMTDIFGKTVCFAYLTKPIPKDDAKESEASDSKAGQAQKVAADVKSDEACSQSESKSSDQVQQEVEGQEQSAQKPKSKKDSVNLFLATTDLDLSDFPTEMIESEEMRALVAANQEYLHFAMYKFRWAIEQCYYQLKVFWNFGGYRLRSRVGIENLINLQNIVYALMSVLPYINKEFEVLVNLSPQERRNKIGEFLRKVEFMGRFVQHIETTENSAALRAVCDYYMENKVKLLDA